LLFPAADSSVIFRPALVEPTRSVPHDHARFGPDPHGPNKVSQGPGRPLPSDRVLVCAKHGSGRGPQDPAMHKEVLLIPVGWLVALMCLLGAPSRSGAG
jgi:hypothetical protein